MSESQQSIMLRVLGLDWPRLRMPVKNFFFSNPGDDYWEDCVQLHRRGLLEARKAHNGSHSVEFVATAEGIQQVVGLRVPRETVVEWMATGRWPQRRKRHVMPWPSHLKRKESP